jgi:hypothetical protein
MAVKSTIYGKHQSLAESSDILLNVADFQAVFIYFAKRHPSEPDFNKLRQLHTSLDSTQDR